MKNKKNLKSYRLKLVGTPKRVLFSRAEQSYEQINPYLIEGAKIIDIGCGGCHVAKTIQDHGFDITPVDIDNGSTIDSIKPIVYDGQKLPFVDNSFDIALLLTVLHHANRPLNLLLEALRVAKRIIIIEDIYYTRFGRIKTQIIDNILNLDFIPHGHTNQSDEGWRRIFMAEGLQFIGKDYWWTLIGPTYIDQALYCLEK